MSRTVSISSTSANNLTTNKVNVNDLLADITTGATARGISIGHAAAARDSGYLNGYIYRRPGSSSIHSHITSPQVTAITKEVRAEPVLSLGRPEPVSLGRPEPVPLARPLPATTSTWTQDHTNSSHWYSPLEQELINSKSPLSVPERDFVTAGKYSGIYVNKREVDNWKGSASIDQYRINDDPNPEVIRKRLDKITYEQVCGVRYLQPVGAPKPGDLIIREKQSVLPPAPPVIIRQEGERPHQPEPIVYREAPPAPPARIPEQVIEIEGGATLAPTRRVVVEKLGNLPQRPADVIIERWLPYKQQKRRVVYQKSGVYAPANPRNLIIEWEAPEYDIKKVCKELGIIEADPEEYIRKYGSELKQAHELPVCDCDNTPKPVPVQLPPPPKPECPPCQPCHPCYSPCYSPCQNWYGYNDAYANHSANHSAHHYAGYHYAGAPYGNTLPATTTHSQSVHHSIREAVVNPVSSIISTTQVGQPTRSARYSESLPELEGDVDALKLVDLDRHGLSEYKNSLATKHISL